jgi:uncharacterized protein YigA (DUF484 family)
MRSVQMVEDRCRKGTVHVARAPDRVAHTLLDAIIDNYKPALEELAFEIAGLEQQVVEQQNRADAYITQGRGMGARRVTLRRLAKASPDFYGEHAPRIRAEAALRLDLGIDKRPGLLVFGAFEAERFDPDQGTDLLTFFGGVFERSLRRWLA